jgi:hypothetical protein
MVLTSGRQAARTGYDEIHGIGLGSNSTKIEGFVPERSLVLALPVSEESSIQNRGRRLAKIAIIVNDHTEGIEFSFKGPLKIITGCQQHALRGFLPCYGKSTAFTAKTLPSEKRPVLSTLQSCTMMA